MANKINGIDSNRTGPVGPGRAVERVRDATTHTKESAGSSSPAGVEITGAARQLAALEKSLGNQPAVDEARAASIRHDIEQGRYKVEPEKIADRLMQFEQALAGLES